jgi:hypothetical protein
VDSTGILQTIAEVAVGLAGFGGIAAGLGYRARGTWSDQDRTRLMGMIVSSLAVVFACLIPHALHHLGARQPWLLSSIPLILAPAWVLFIQSRQVFGWARPGRIFVRSGFNPSFALMIMVVNLIALALLLLSVVGIFDADRAFGIYLATVLLLLFISAANFVRLLTTSFGEKA